MEERSSRSLILKGTLSSYFIAVSASIILSYWFPIGQYKWVLIFLVPVVLSGFLIVESDGIALPLTLGISNSITIKIISFTFPPSLIGMDPDKYAVYTSKIIHSGFIVDGFDGFYSDFYTRAPAFFLQIASFDIITGVKLTAAFGSIPLILGVLTPFLSFLLTREGGGGDMALRTVLFLSPLAVIVTKYSYWPIPQSISNIFFIFVIIYVVRGMWSGGFRYKVLYYLFCTTAIFTHKVFTPIFVISVLTIVLVYQLLVRRNQISASWYPPIELVAISGLAVVFQYGYLSSFISKVVIRFNQLLRFDLVSQPVTFAGAIPPYSAIEQFFIINIHWIWVLPTAFISLLFSYYRTDYRAIILHSPIILISPLMIVGILSFRFLSPLRVYSVVEIFLISISAIFIGEVYTNCKGKLGVKEVMLALLVMMLIFSQVSSFNMYSDSPMSPRYHLTQEEISAKAFASEWLEGPVYTDSFYASEETPDEINENTGTSIEYVSFDNWLFDNNLSNLNKTYLIRTKVVFYPSINYGWKKILSPNPIRYNNKIYNNGEVSGYKNN